MTILPFYDQLQNIEDLIKNGGFVNPDMWQCLTNQFYEEFNIDEDTEIFNQAWGDYCDLVKFYDEKNAVDVER
jgi:hypothetical protein